MHTEWVKGLVEIYNFAPYFAVSYLKAPLCRLLYHRMCWIIRMGYVFGGSSLKNETSQQWTLAHSVYVLLHIHSQCPQVGPNEAGSVCRFVTVSFLVLLWSRYITIINILMMTVYQIVPAGNYHLRLLYRHNFTILVHYHRSRGVVFNSRRQICFGFF